MIAPERTDALLGRLRAGDGQAVGDLFDLHRDRLRRMLAVRLDRRLARRSELQARLRDALDDMEPLDREVLALRHFEELGNGETAAVLGISKDAASKRHIRALKRLRAIFTTETGGR